MSYLKSWGLMLAIGLWAALTLPTNAAPIILGTPGSGAASGTDTCNATCIANAFSAANITTGTWTIVGQPETFGADANGFFNSGGVVQLKLELANDNNAFGVMDNPPGPGTLFQLLTTNGNNVGDSANFSNPDTNGLGGSTFAFYFKDLTTNRICTSDSSNCDNNLDMAIYQNGNVFAFFFDDGGGNNDNDYNDMVVTATLAGGVPEPMSLGLLGAGLLGMGIASTRSRKQQRRAAKA